MSKKQRGRKRGLKKKKLSTHRDEELPPFLVLVLPSRSTTSGSTPSGRVKHPREREPRRRNARWRRPATAGLHPQRPLALPDGEAVGAAAGVGGGLGRRHHGERKAPVLRRRRARRQLAQVAAVVRDHAHLDDGLCADRAVREAQRRFERVSQSFVIDLRVEVSEEELALVWSAVRRRGRRASASASRNASIRLAEHVSPGGVESRRRRDGKVGARGQAGCFSAAAVAAPSAAAELLQKALVLIVRLLPFRPATSSLHPRHVAGILRLHAGLQRHGELERVPSRASRHPAGRALKLPVAAAAAQKARVPFPFLESAVDDGQLAELLVLGVVEPVVLRVEHGRDPLGRELHGLAGVAFEGVFSFFIEKVSFFSLILSFSLPLPIFLSRSLPLPKKKKQSKTRTFDQDVEVVVLAVVVPGRPRRPLFHRAAPADDDAAPCLRLQLALRLASWPDDQTNKVEVGVLLLRNIQLLALLLRAVVVRRPVGPVFLDQLLDDVLAPLGEPLPRADLPRVEPDPAPVIDGLRGRAALRRRRDLPVVLAQAPLDVDELVVEGEHLRVVRLLGGTADDGVGELDLDAAREGELARAGGGREREGGGGRGGDLGHRDLAGALKGRPGRRRRRGEGAGRQRRKGRRRHRRRRRRRQR